MGVQVAVGPATWSTRASRCWRTAGGARPRSATPRRAWTTCTTTARIRRSRWASSSSTTPAPRPARCWPPGRRRRGRCRPTSPSPSGRTSTTPSSTTSGRRLIIAEARLGHYAAELGDAPVVGRVTGRRAGRAPLPPAVRLLHRRRPVRHRAGVPGARRRLRVHRRRHRRRAPRARASARTTSWSPTPPASPRSCRWTSTADTPPRSPNGPACRCSTPTPT